MLLTDKAKEDFLKWYYKNIHVVGMCDIDENLDQAINTLIIEWLDSVNIYLNIENLYYQSWWSFKVKNCPNTYEEKVMVKTRLEATEKAIIKANEIYNNLNTKQNEK